MSDLVIKTVLSEEAVKNESRKREMRRYYHSSGPNKLPFTDGNAD